MIGITVLAFVLSIVMFRFVPQQFFPDSTRPELMVDMELAEGASLRSTQAQAEKLEKLLGKRSDIDNYVAYVGTGSPRFYLPLDQQLPQANFAQFVVTAKDLPAREALRSWMIDKVGPQFPQLQFRVTRLENGPPVGYPIQFRVAGEHIDRVQALARQVAAQVRTNPDVTNVNLDWDEPSKVVRLSIDQDRARTLGVSTADVSHFLTSSLSGLRVSTYREGNELIEILLRGPDEERARLDLLGSLAVPTPNGSVPLSQIANIEYAFEDGIIWHRNRLPTVTVRADIRDGVTPPSVTAAILPTPGKDPRRIAGRLSAGNRRHGRGFRARAEVDRRRHAVVPAGRGHPADVAAAKFLAHGPGHADCAAGVDRGDVRLAACSGCHSVSWPCSARSPWPA